MRILVLTCLFFWSAVTFAKITPVKIQCHFDGPIYSGSLDFETDVTKWNGEFSGYDCDFSTQGYLSFDNRVYELSFIVKDVNLDVKKQCKIDSWEEVKDEFRGDYGAITGSAINPRTGYETQAEIKLDKATGKITTFKIANCYLRE
jgi:hypothetical protein